MNDIKLAPIRSEKKEVENFLIDLQKAILALDEEQDFVFISKKKALEEEQYSTPYTLLELGYDRTDILQVLAALTVKNYSETLFDVKNENPPLLYVFGTYIQQKEIYIKLKIRESKKKTIICISFHFSKIRMTYPYK